MLRDATPHDVDLIELVRVISSNRSTAMLVLENGIHQGEIHFNEGRIVHALCGPLQGDQALLELLAWKTGTLNLVPLRPSTQQASTGEVSFCVREGAGIQNGDAKLAIPLLELLR